MSEEKYIQCENCLGEFPEDYMTPINSQVRGGGLEPWCDECLHIAIDLGWINNPTDCGDRLFIHPRKVCRVE